MGYVLKMGSGNETLWLMGQWWPKSKVHLWQIVGKMVGEFKRVVGGGG